MNKYLIIYPLLVFWLVVGKVAISHTPPLAESETLAKAHDIIRRADRVRAPEHPFRYTLTLVEYRGGKEIKQSQQVLDVAMKMKKPDSDYPDGELKALIRFLQPVRDRGKVLLMDFDKMWYYTPDLRRPIPISKQQRLVGQVANGDVAAADFDTSYKPLLVGEEPCGDKRCYKLKLTRLRPAVIYPAIVYWVEKGSYFPYRADFLSSDGLLLKRSYYSHYKKLIGQMRPTRIVVEDALRKNYYTTMDYTNLRLESLPDFYFQKEYLMRLR